MDLSYIQTIAVNTGTDISSWDLKKIFGDIKDRREINKRFFTQVELTKKSVAKKPKKRIISAKVSKELSKNIGANKVKMTMEIKLKDLMKQSENLADEQTKVQEQIQALKRKLRGSKENSASILLNQVKEIVNDGFWENPIFTKDGRYLWLNTKNDVVVHRISEKLSADSSINFGKYAARINLTNFEVRVGMYKSNLQYGSDIHPFLSCDDDGMSVQVPCYGNAYNLYNNLKANMELSKLMKLTAALLVSYDSENGYCSLEDFDHADEVDPQSSIYEGLSDVYRLSAIGDVKDFYHPDVWKEFGQKAVDERKSDGHFDDDDDSDGEVTVE